MTQEAKRNPGPSTWQAQRPFILGYIGAVLIPLAMLMAYSCYDKGRVRHTGPVTVTHTWSYLKGGRPSTGSGGTRFGSDAGSSSRWAYSVWGETEAGQQCFIDVDTHQDFLRYKKGETVQAPYFVHKDRGDWQWTEMANVWQKFWLVAWGMLIVWVVLKGN